MELNDISRNPWAVETLDVYLHYCCPECDHKSKTKLLFVDHAYECHPDAKDTLQFEESKEDILIKSDVPIKEEPDGNINEDIPNEMVDIYYDQLEDWYETEEEPKPKKARRGRPSKNYNLSEQNSDEEWKDVKKLKRKIKGRPKKKEIIDEEEGPFQCYRCGENYDLLNEIKDHVIEKHRVCRKSYYGKPRNHQCHVCQLMFETKEDCNVHKCRFDCNMAGVEKWGKSHCDVCNLDFAGRDLLLNHNLTYHVTEKKFACDLCDFKTKLAKNLTIHKKRVHDKIREEICHVCGKAFFDKVVLRQHVNDMHTEGEKEFVCEKCGATYTSMSSLKGHVREKHPVYYLCAYCDKKMYLSQKKLRVHLLNEHSVKCGTKDFYVCWKCKKCCSSFKDLDDHLIGEHEMKQDEHRCQLCQDKTFASKITLKMHVVEFHDIDFSKVSNTPFIRELFNIITEPNIQTMPGSGIPCPVCQKKFSSNRSLSDHRRQVHEKANHIKCSHCDFSTFQPYMLKKHIQRQHTKTTKYECDQCSYTTYDYHAIGVHKKRHDKTKVIQCSECDKAFVKEKRREYAQHLLQSHNIVYQWN